MVMAKKGESNLKVLAVDDSPVIAKLVKSTLTKAGMDVVTAGDCESGLGLLDASFSAVLMDLGLPGMDGVAGIEEVRQRLPEMPCVVISAGEDVQRAVAAMKAGACDYLRKPFDTDELVLRVQHAIHTAQTDTENALFRGSMSQAGAGESWIGVSPQSVDVLAKARQIATSDATVLITGETGVGKSLLARHIHSIGNRSDKPFVAVSCATLPADLVEAELFGHEKGAFTGATREKAGRVEIAGEGTIFLDEIGEMPLSLQPKVLRVLQEREFERVGGTKTHHMEARVIACTSRNLRAMCEDGEFREALYFRISVLPIEIPPLRERRKDIEPLVDRFLGALAAKSGIVKRLATDARNILRAHSWPGNVRELQNSLERAFTFATGNVIEARHLTFLFSHPAKHSSASLAGRTLSDIEKEDIQQTLDACNGNKAQAARSLGVSEKSIYNKMDRLGLR